MKINLKQKMETTKQRIYLVLDEFKGKNIDLYKTIRNSLPIDIGISPLVFDNDNASDICFEFFLTRVEDKITDADGVTNIMTICGESDDTYSICFVEKPFFKNRAPKKADVVIFEKIKLEKVMKKLPFVIEQFRLWK